MKQPFSLCLCSVCGVLFRTTDGYYNAPAGKQCLNCADRAQETHQRPTEDK